MFSSHSFVSGLYFRCRRVPKTTNITNVARSSTINRFVFFLSRTLSYYTGAGRQQLRLRTARALPVAVRARGPEH